MTPSQRELLEAIEGSGGVFDRYGRVLAEGQTHNSVTALWCFIHGWIESDGGGRCCLTLYGSKALVKECQGSGRR